MTKSKLMIRILAAALLLVALFSAVSCGDKNYKPVKSSAEERREMVTLSGGETVRYELLRAFLYAMSGEYDGGDPSVWSGENAAALFSELTEAAMAEVAQIYATLAVCKKYGIDPNGKKVDAEVERRVRADIDGALIDDTLIEGYGSKKKYLAALKKMHLNDSVNRLLHRYDVCASLLYEQVVTDYDGFANAVTRAEVEAFYYSENCAQITWLFVSNATFDIPNATEAAKEEFLANVYAQLYDARASFSALKSVIVKYTHNLSDDQIENGFCISRLGGFGTDARKLAQAAFSLRNLEISERITTEDGIYYLIGLSKSAEYFTAHYEELYDLCLANRLYGELDEKAEALLSGAVYTDAYRALDPAALFLAK